jgi:hypothetical protein
VALSDHFKAARFCGVQFLCKALADAQDARWPLCILANAVPLRRVMLRITPCARRAHARAAALFVKDAYDLSNHGPIC